MPAGAIYYDADGIEQFQPAEMVIVACNGVGTPRLLLNSASARFPNGLANSSGQMGRNLMFHPYALIYGYADEPLDGNRATPLCVWSHEFYETDSARGFVRGYAYQFGRGIGPVIEAITSSVRGRHGDPGRRRSQRHRRRTPDPLRRLASAWHRPHGRRSRELGRERLGAQSRREEPVHRRWLALRHLRRREPDLYDTRTGAVHRRQHQAAPGDAVRLRPARDVQYLLI